MRWLAGVLTVLWLTPAMAVPPGDPLTAVDAYRICLGHADPAADEVWFLSEHTMAALKPKWQPGWEDICSKVRARAVAAIAGGEQDVAKRSEAKREALRKDDWRRLMDFLAKP